MMVYDQQGRPLGIYAGPVPASAQVQPGEVDWDMEADPIPRLSVVLSSVPAPPASASAPAPYKRPVCGDMLFVDIDGVRHVFTCDNDRLGTQSEDGDEPAHKGIPHRQVLTAPSSTEEGDYPAMIWYHQGE